MCGRFSVTSSVAAMAQMFGATPSNDLPNLPNYNICPTDQVCAVISREGVRHLVSLRWGFIPHWYKTPSDGALLINARGEMIAQKPAFAQAARERRCLIPVTGFYEWTKDATDHRLPWYIHPTNDRPMALAGIWQNWRAGGVEHATCAIVTTAASKIMRGIHHREPVILAEQGWAKWLGEAGHGAASLMVSAPEDCMKLYRVGPEVNSNRASGPRLIERLETQKAPPHGQDL